MCHTRTLPSRPPPRPLSAAGSAERGLATSPFKGIKISLYEISGEWSHGPALPTAVCRPSAVRSRPPGRGRELRVLALLAEAELTVSDLTDVCGSHQPRFHGTSAFGEPGLVDVSTRVRRRFSGLASGAAVPRSPANWSPAGADRPDVMRDRERLTAVRASRPGCARLSRAATPQSRTASASFTSPTRRSRRRSARRLPTGHSVPPRSRHQHQPYAELFRPDLERGLGLDISHDMLALARARLDQAGCALAACGKATHDLALPRDSFDVIIIHQVLHFLDDAQRAIARRTRAAAGGRLLVVDSRPRSRIPARRARPPPARLCAGDSDAIVQRYQPRFVARNTAAGSNSDGKIAVSLWLGRDRRIMLADPALRPHARLPDEYAHASQPLRPDRRRAPHPRTPRILPAEERGHGEERCRSITRLAALKAELHFRDVRRQ